MQLSGTRYIPSKIGSAMRKFSIRIALSAALVGLLFWSYTRLSDWLLLLIERQMNATFGSYYHMQYESLDATFMLQSLSVQIQKPQFATDTTLAHAHAGYPAIFFNASRIEVSGIGIWQLIQNKKLAIDEIKIIEPGLLYLIPEKLKPNALDTIAVDEPQKHALNELFINRIQLAGGSIAVAAISDASNVLYQGSDIQLDIDQVRIHQLQQKQINTDSLFQNLRLSLKKLEFHPSRASHAFGAASLMVDLNQRTIELKEVDVLPHKSILKLSKEYQYQKTFAEVHLGNLKISGLNHNDIIHGQIAVDKVQVDGARIQLMRNKTKPLDTDLKKPALQDALKRIGLDLQVDTVLIQNAQLDVGLLFASSSKPAHVKLSSISGTIYHLHNHNRTQQSMKVDLKAKVMKTAKLRFKLDMPIHKSTHTYHAVITNMPLHEWNDVIAKAAPLQIQSGIGKRLVMQGSANATHTSGKMTFEYNELKCEVYKTNKQGVKKKAYLKSLLVNTIVRNNNPVKPGLEVASVSYSYQRELYQGHEMLWIGGLLDGMMQTMLPTKIKAEVDKSKQKKKLSKQKKI